jgi:hypothetical protein
MKDESTVPTQPTPSRRSVLARGLGIGVTAAAGALVAAAASRASDTAQGGTSGETTDGVAHGGLIHTQKHGGVLHGHDEKGSHNHAVMVHTLDVETIRAVDTGP